jgi:hypothetical protein
MDQRRLLRAGRQLEALLESACDGLVVGRLEVPVAADVQQRKALAQVQLAWLHCALTCRCRVRLGDECGHRPGSEAWQRFDALCVELWEHLTQVAEADGDGRIGEKEYKDAFARGMLETGESFDAAYVPFLEALLELVAGDRDGLIDVDEEIRWTEALMRLSEAEARRAFAGVDEDGDGYITTSTTTPTVPAAGCSAIWTAELPAPQRG